MPKHLSGSFSTLLLMLLFHFQTVFCFADCGQPVLELLLCFHRIRRSSSLSRRSFKLLFHVPRSFHLSKISIREGPSFSPPICLLFLLGCLNLLHNPHQSGACSKTERETGCDSRPLVTTSAQTAPHRTGMCSCVTIFLNCFSDCTV